LRTSKPNATSALTLKHQSGFGREAPTYSESPQLTLSKRKVKEFSRSDEPSETGNRRSSPCDLFGDVPEAQ